MLVGGEPRREAPAEGHARAREAREGAGGRARGTGVAARELHDDEEVRGAHARGDERRARVGVAASFTFRISAACFSFSLAASFLAISFAFWARARISATAMGQSVITRLYPRVQTARALLGIAHAEAGTDSFLLPWQGIR